MKTDHCHLTDRWYAQFTLFNEIHALGSSYVCRLRDNSRYDVREERPLSGTARAAGVIQDAVVTLGATGNGSNVDPARMPCKGKIRQPRAQPWVTIVETTV